VLHRTSVSPIPHSDKITQFIKAKQQKNKAIDQIFLFKEKKKQKTTAQSLNCKEVSKCNEK